MNSPNTQRPPRTSDLEGNDLTQEIEAPLDDSRQYRDEATLSRLDFEEVEIAFDL
jgi:hypothetical protein